jgi:hypothetical protein
MTVPSVRQVPSSLLAFPWPNAGICDAASNKNANATPEIALKETCFFIFISFRFEIVDLKSPLDLNQ